MAQCTISFDDTAGVYELFTSEGDWVGAYDSYAEAAAARTEQVPA